MFVAVCSDTPFVFYFFLMIRIYYSVDGDIFQCISAYLFHKMSSSDNTRESAYLVLLVCLPASTAIRRLQHP